MILFIYFCTALVNVFLHILRSILVIKSTKFAASLANCVTYTFSAVVIKFIAEFDLWIAICVQAITNFIGTWLAMYVYEIYEKMKNIKRSQLWITRNILKSQRKLSMQSVYQSIPEYWLMGWFNKQKKGARNELLHSRRCSQS